MSDIDIDKMLLIVRTRFDTLLEKDRRSANEVIGELVFAVSCILTVLEQMQKDRPR
jgi:hypothetical protein